MYLNLTSNELLNPGTNLYRCDGAFLCGGDSLLHGTHVGSQGWLITHSRGDTTQQSRHLRKKRGKKKK